MKKNTFTMLDEKGQEHTYDVLFTFDSDETHKSYIAYTDNTTDENGNIKVYANTYDPTGESLALEPLTEEKEWKVIENILMSVQEKVREAAAEEAGTNEAE